MTTLVQIRTPSGSKIHRAWQCPPSMILPQIKSDEAHLEPARRRGKAIHKFLERVKAAGVEEARAECADKELQPLLNAIELESLPTHLATEVAFAYDWKARTAREVKDAFGEPIEDRHYELADPPLAPTEIPCTVDLVGGQVVGGVRRAYAGDYKTGYSRYPAPDKFGQTLLAGLCVSLVYECTEAVLEIIYIHKNGDNHKVRRTVDMWTLETFADEIEAAMEIAELDAKAYAAGRGVTAREGPHCDYCEAYKQCPAKIALVRSIPRELVAIDGGEITREKGAELWMTIERIEEILSRVKQEICGLAAFGDIDLPDGRVIGRLVTERESLDGPIAAQVIESSLGMKARDEAVEISVSKDAVRRVVSRYRPNGAKITTKNQDGVMDKILAEVRARGGSEYTRTDAVKPHVPRRSKALKSGT